MGSPSGTPCLRRVSEGSGIILMTAWAIGRPRASVTLPKTPSSFVTLWRAASSAAFFAAISAAVGARVPFVASSALELLSREVPPAAPPPPAPSSP